MSKSILFISTLGFLTACGGSGAEALGTKVGKLACEQKKDPSKAADIVKQIAELEKGKKEYTAEDAKAYLAAYTKVVSACK